MPRRTLLSTFRRGIARFRPLQSLSRIPSWVGRSCTATANLLFPPACQACDGELPAEHKDPWLICQDCLEAFRTDQPACPLCASPIPRGMPDSPDCPRCRKRDYRFDAAIAVGIYRARLQEAVLKMKQAIHEPLTISMGRLLGAQILERLAAHRPELLLPVPMHWTRRLLRGTSTAGMLAEAAARASTIPARFDLLACSRRMQKQGTLTPTERFRNALGAFRLRAGYAIKDAHVLVVDDVLTTGATVSEVAKVLKRAGAARVTVAVVARGVGVG